MNFAPNLKYADSNDLIREDKILMVETLFFDLDNTLLDFNQAERAAIAKTLESFHIAPEPMKLFWPKGTIS